MIFLVSSLTSIGILGVAAMVSFGLGLLIKTGVIVKQRKRILLLEDEMLANHAKILSLEKNLAEQSKEDGGGQKTDYELQNLKTDHGGLKAS